MKFICLLFFSFALSQEGGKEGDEVSAVPTINITGSTRTEYWFFLGPDTIRKTEHFETNTSLVISYDKFYLNGSLFLFEPSSGKNRLRLLGGSFAYRTPFLELSLGDFYSLFGRGLSLRSYCDESFRYDKRLFGFFAKGEFKKNEIILLSARPKNLFFEDNFYRFENDTTDLLRGVEFNSSLIPYLELGGRYVRLNRKKDITPQAFTEIFGPSLGISYKSLDFYYEFVRKLETREVVGGRKKGKGSYLSLSFSGPFLGVTFEYGNYDSIDFGGTGFRYNDPPTPVKKGVPINRGVDEQGFGIGLQSSFSSVKLEGNYAWFYTHKREKGVQEFNGKGEIGLLWLTPVVMLEHLKMKRIEEGIDFREEWEPGAELRFNFLNRGFELAGSINFVKEDGFSYQERRFSVSGDILPSLSLAFSYEKATEKVKRYDYQDRWLVGEGTFNLLDNLSLRLRVGQEKGGLVCSGGVCRYEAPFFGVKGLLLMRF